MRRAAFSSLMQAAGHVVVVARHSASEMANPSPDHCLSRLKKHDYPCLPPSNSKKDAPLALSPGFFSPGALKPKHKITPRAF
jgi:hypothetical protein